MQASVYSLTLIGARSQGFASLLGSSSRTYVKNFWSKSTAFPLPGDTAKRPTHFTHNSNPTVSDPHGSLADYSWLSCNWEDWEISDMQPVDKKLRASVQMSRFLPLSLT